MVTTSVVKDRNGVQEYPTMFGCIEERNVVFAVDTSGSMFGYMDAIKEHLIEALRILSSTDFLFNIIAFSADVNKFAEWLVPCNEKSWDVAKSWITALTCKTTTNTLEAITAAYEDDRTHAVYLVSDGLPDQGPKEVIEAIRKMKNKKPIHALYVPSKTHNKKNDMESASEFLLKLAQITGGSFRLVIFGDNGHVESIKTVYTASVNKSKAKTDTRELYSKGSDLIKKSNEEIVNTNTRSPQSTNKLVKQSPQLRRSKLIMEMEEQKRIGDASKDNDNIGAYLSTQGIPEHSSVAIASNIPSSTICSSPNLQQSPLSNIVKNNAVNVQSNNTSRPEFSSNQKGNGVENITVDGLINSVRLQPDQPSTVAGSLLIDKKVLCRYYEDGHYYLGTVKKQLNPTLFQVELILPKKKRVKNSQETSLNDIIALNDAWRHSIKIGDKVLAPTKLGKYEYAPAIVMEGNDSRTLDGKTIGSVEPMIVVFSSGLTKTVNSNSTVWISDALYNNLAMNQLIPNHLHEDMNRIIADSIDSRTPWRERTDFTPCNAYKTLHSDAYNTMLSNNTNGYNSALLASSSPPNPSTGYHNRPYSAMSVDNRGVTASPHYPSLTEYAPYTGLTSRIDEQICTIERYLNALNHAENRSSNYLDSEEDEESQICDSDVLNMLYEELGLNDEDNVIRTTSQYCKTKPKQTKLNQRPPWKSWYAAPAATGPTEKYQPNLLKAPRTNVPPPKREGNYLDHVRMVNPDYPNWWKYQQKEIQQERKKYQAPTWEEGLTNMKHKKQLKEEQAMLSIKQKRQEKQLRIEKDREQLKRDAVELKRKHKLEKMSGYERFDQQRKRYYEELKKRLVTHRRKTHDKVKELEAERELIKKDKEAKKFMYLQQQRHQREQIQIQRENEKIQREQDIKVNRLKRAQQRHNAVAMHEDEENAKLVAKDEARFNAHINRRKQLIANRLADEENRQRRIDVKRERAMKVKIELGY